MRILFLVILVVSLCSLSFAGDPVTAPPDTINVGLPTITLSHGTTVILMFVFGAIAALSEFFGLNKSVAVNSVLGWLLSFASGALNALKNAHNGTDPK